MENSFITPVRPEIGAMEIDSGTREVICAHATDGTGTIHSLAVSPDGTKLAFAYGQALAVVPVSGGDPEVVLTASDTGERKDT